MATDLRDSVQSSLGSAYTLERELEGAGMSRVFLATETALGRRVVVKVLPPELGEAISAERFRREVLLTAGLQHPHVVPVLAAGEAAGLLYYTMPYVDGESLAGRLAREGALPVGDVARLVREIGDALDAAHEHGIVHRDVKPANVLLSRGHALVTDFGVARAMLHATGADGAPRDAAGTSPREVITRTGFSVGTPAYMSPEQALGQREVDGRSDQYGLACVAFELLAGQRPFAGSGVEQIARRFTEPPPSVRAVRPALPSAVDAVLARAFALAPGARFPSAGAFADALARALEASPAARPAGSAWRGRRAMRRGLLVGGAVVVASGAVVLARVRGTTARPATPAGAPATIEPAPGGPTAWRGLPSVAVLPLRDYSGDPAQAYFADGMTDELTATLSKIAGLRVIAHQSVRQFRGSSRPVPEIARLLGVRHVVDGSVLQDGARVRVRASLVDASTSTPVWTESFDRERRDVLALQRDVALAVARAVQVALSPQDRARLAEAPAVDPAAFAFYVRGTQARYRAFGDAQNRDAVRHFESAIAEDSAYAPAHAGLAFVRVMIGDEAGARRSARRALALDPQLAEAHMVLGLVRQVFDWDWAGAEAELREALRQNPGYAEAHHELSMLLLRRGRFDEALGEARLTIYLAPMSARFENAIGEIQLCADRPDEALAAAGRALALDSAYAAPHFLRAYAYLRQRRLGAAEASLRACLARDCGDSGVALLAHVHALLGRREEALRGAAALTAKWRARPDPGLAMGLAQIHVGLGERERALEWLERGADAGAYMLYLGIDPTFRPLHGEPRFRALLKRIGLAG
ncbi:MAG TPA: protein kinase [Gemmatirosa sp.]|nr:protein kinase [Gemmatirosa sp.]